MIWDSIKENRQVDKIFKPPPLSKNVTSFKILNATTIVRLCIQFLFIRAIEEYVVKICHEKHDVIYIPLFCHHTINDTKVRAIKRKVISGSHTFQMSNKNLAVK